MSISLRIAEIKDLGHINTIYNQAVANRYQTADLSAINMSQRHQWFATHDKEKYLVQVLELNQQIIGWSSLSKYREGRLALQSTAEVSYYIHDNHLRKGHGSYLLEQTIQAARRVGFNKLVALLLSSNHASIQLLKKFDFIEWGRIPAAAEIDNQFFDHLYYGCSIS